MRCCLAFIVVLSWLSLPATSLAEHVRVQLKGGGEAAGELKEYVPGDHVTMDIGDGKLLRVAASSALSVEIGAAGVLPSAKGVEAAQSQTVQSIVLQNLLEERRYWETRYTSVVLPATLVPLGALVLAIGIGTFMAWDGNDSSTGARTKGVMIGGALVMAGGLAVLPFRTSKGRQRRELNRINERLQGLGVHASLAPWFAPRTSAASGTSAGLTTSFRF